MRQENFSSPLELKKVAITDEFWGREQELVRTEVIPYQWEALNDRIPEAAPSFCMRNFRVAGRLMSQKREKGAGFVPPTYTFRGFEALPEDPAHPDPDRFYGFVFQDSDFAKWIEAVGYSLTNHPDAELERTADEAIDVVCAAQAENGYLDTYYIINGMDRIFTNLRDHHELYCFGHLAEGAIAYYQATGKDKLLKAAERYADFIASKFGPEDGKCKGYPGHEIAEMALARLYELTGEKRYLELGNFFLEMRGTKPYYFDVEDRERAEHEGRPWRELGEEMRFQYHQAHMPVREQTEAVGHAVRAVYLYSGMADMARLNRDEAMFAACERLWDSIVNEKMYITGGIGGTHIGEAFSYPYDLPNDTAYSETCAAIGLAFFARRMLEIQADNRYGDVMEQALYNTVLAGMALDGKSFFYVNPLEVLPEACERDERKHHVKSVRQKWFGCACCPPNIARIVSSIGSYAYTAGRDVLYTHLYVGSRISFEWNGVTVDMRVESGFPWEGKVRATLHIDGSSGEELRRETISQTEGKAPTGERKGACGALAFRIPGWCRSMTAEVRGANGLSLECEEPPREMTSRRERGYLYLSGEWRDGDEIHIDIPMEVRCVTANEKVREDIGKVALLRGPICYCMEEADNGRDLHLLRVDLERAMGKTDARNGAQAQDAVHSDVDFSGIEVAVSRKLGHEMRVLKAPGFRRETSFESASLYRTYAPVKETETVLTFVPYYAWNNRGAGEMSVWVRGE